jgi:hypothetical protein
MARVGLTTLLLGSLCILFAPDAAAGSTTYEPTYPPRIIAVTAKARAFYLEFRGRHEAGGFGHAYVILGTIDGIGQVSENVVVGFMPKSAEDDYWSKFGVPVTGWVGVARSDFTRRPEARFRIAVSRTTYFRTLNKIRSLRNTWTMYVLLLRNCNDFVNEIASSVALRTPTLTVQYPVDYVTELRVLNSR